MKKCKNKEEIVESKIKHNILFKKSSDITIAIFSTLELLAIFLNKMIFPAATGSILIITTIILKTLGSSFQARKINRLIKSIQTLTPLIISYITQKQKQKGEHNRMKEKLKKLKTFVKRNYQTLLGTGGFSLFVVELTLIVLGSGLLQRLGISSYFVLGILSPFVYSVYNAIVKKGFENEEEYTLRIEKLKAVIESKPKKLSRKEKQLLGLAKLLKDNPDIKNILQ